MYKIIRYAVCIIYFLCMTSGAYAECTVTDDLGHPLHLIKPAQRIISLAPDLTEILFAVGAGQQVVGVVQGSDYPEVAKTIPIVATYNSLNIEKIMTLRPDLVIAWTETNYVSQLKKLGIPVYLSHPHRLTDVAFTMKKLGCLAGTEKIANVQAEHYLTHYQALKKKYAKRQPVRVFYQLWSQPLMTITQRSWINEAIELCGGQNIFSNLPGTAPEVSLEAIVLANPDVIIASKQEGIKQWQHWTQIKAVSTHNVFSINADLLDRAGPRLLDGVDKLCELLTISGPKEVS